MWVRSEVKAKGLSNFKKNYWKSVLAALIYMLFFGATATTFNSKRSSIDVSDPDFLAIMLAILAAVAVLLLICKLIDIFLLNPLEVGCQRFFLVNQDADAQLGELGHAYKNNYGKVVLGIFLRDLLICLGLIVIVPGLILSYSYRLVPYILAEDTTISGPDALKKSRAMMNGHKWNAFVYDLSFIGWILLTAITFGIVGIFYFDPYKMNADAALYQAIKGENE
ncbi:MAG: DUF975 family protein [Lachnospiraceae bacterium]|nr:DUF975 family protein [Lachnospiraceae bacterium]